MTSKGPVDAKFDQLMDVLSNAMHLEVQLDRRMGRFLEKRTIALRHLTKVSEFFRIPEKFPIKEGKVYLDQEFLAKCFMNRLDWERRGVTQGFQPKSSSDATDFRNFNGILYDATSADLTASITELQKLTESEYAQAQEQLFEIINAYFIDPGVDLPVHDPHYAINAYNQLLITVQGRTVAGQATINRILSTALSEKAETSKEFKRYEAQWRTALYGSGILRKDRHGPPPPEILLQATLSMQLGAATLSSGNENLRIKLIRASNRQEDLRAAGTLSLESLFQEWNNAYAAAELENPRQDAGPAIVLHVQGRDHEDGNYRDKNVQGKLPGRGAPRGAPRGAVKAGPRRSPTNGDKKPEGTKRVFKVSLDERLGNIESSHKDLRAAVAELVATVKGLRKEQHAAFLADAEPDSDEEYSAPIHRKGGDRNGGGGQGWKRKERTFLAQIGPSIGDSADIQEGHDDHSDPDDIDLLSGLRGIDPKAEQIRAMLAARTHCINTLSESWMEPDRKTPVVAKHRIISKENIVPGSYEASELPPTSMEEYKDSDAEDLPELVSTSEDEDDGAPTMGTRTSLIDSGAGQTVLGATAPSTDRRRSSRTPLLRAHYKPDTTRQKVGRAKATSTSKTTTPAPTPSASATKRKGREPTPPTPAPELRIVYVDDVLEVTSSIQHKSACARSARRPRTSRRSEASGTDESADPLDSDSA